LPTNSFVYVFEYFFDLLNDVQFISYFEQWSIQILNGVQNHSLWHVTSESEYLDTSTPTPLPSASRMVPYGRDLRRRIRSDIRKPRKFAVYITPDPRQHARVKGA